MKPDRYILILAAVALGGCEPKRGIVAEKAVSPFLFANIVCVDTALRKAFGKVDRWDYVSDGGTYPTGTKVLQYAYYRSKDGRGTATLHIGLVDNETLIKHAFTGAGSELSQESFPPAMRAMRKAGRVLDAACGLDLLGMELKAVGQSVDALD